MSTISTFTPVTQSSLVTPASPKNIPPNPFESALGKYSTVIGEEIRIPPLVVQARRSRATLSTQGYVPRVGLAAKVEEAAEQLENRRSAS
ncbi:9005_t:CDS:2 [Ambispora gerdemannii]|uniref:9005_t:CDS:1 n=1 Tax=Ambispora gerdemannii TaxID=144530 RepID=A0A9N9CHZ0_9GLOM|nr:9005_t:CDS:2 [Ambispora gerdemannii]